MSAKHAKLFAFFHSLECFVLLSTGRRKNQLVNTLRLFVRGWELEPKLSFQRRLIMNICLTGGSKVTLNRQFTWLAIHGGKYTGRLKCCIIRILIQRSSKNTRSQVQIRSPALRSFDVVAYIGIHKMAVCLGSTIPGFKSEISFYL